jgi:fatty acid desaturase
VSGGLFTDIGLVGLNHQVEHHLFPTCPRNKLARLQPFVMRACEDLGIDYVEQSFIETNRSILGKLNAASGD